MNFENEQLFYIFYIADMYIHICEWREKWRRESCHVSVTGVKSANRSRWCVASRLQAVCQDPDNNNRLVKLLMWPVRGNENVCCWLWMMGAELIPRRAVWVYVCMYMFVWIGRLLNRHASISASAASSACCARFVTITKAAATFRGIQNQNQLLLSFFFQFLSQFLLTFFFVKKSLRWICFFWHH